MHYRGAVFSVSFNAAQMTVRVATGSLSVRDASGGESTVGAGQSKTIARGAAQLRRV